MVWVPLREVKNRQWNYISLYLFVYFSPGKPKTTLDCWFPAQLTDNQIKTGTKMCLIQESHWVLDKAWNPRMDRNKTKVNVFPSIEGASKNIFYQTATIMEIFVTSQVVLVVVAFVLLRNVACRAGTQARVLVAGLGGSPLQVDAARGLRRGFCTTVTYILIQVGVFGDWYCFVDTDIPL